MADDSTRIEVSLPELREVAGYAVACARGRLRVRRGVPPPLVKATQVKHILGSAAHAARAFELSAGDDPAIGVGHIAQSRILAPPVVVDVLRRYPPAPPGGGRVGELIRQLDTALR